MGRTSPAAEADSVASLHQYPAGALLRLPDVLCIIPVCRASWYSGIARGDYPAPVRVGKRSVAWRVEDVLKLRERMVSGEAFGQPEATRREPV